MKKRSCLPILLLGCSLLFITLLAVAWLVPIVAEDSFGPPSIGISRIEQVTFGLELLWNATDITLPKDPSASEVQFSIEPGEDVLSVATRLESLGVIKNARRFRIFLLWTGMDRTIQSGLFRLSPAVSAEEIASNLQSITLTEVPFTVLPGWRMEEIAVSLPTTGLEITPDEFMQAVISPAFSQTILPPGSSTEGFLCPGTTTLPRTTSANELVALLFQQFLGKITPEMQNEYTVQGLTLFQAVTLASIIEREVVVNEEMPLVASVFHNRLRIGMGLQTDPTVQYAIGYNQLQATWWTNPLSVGDLQFDSPYNTYIYPGLPPGPISNPSLEALMAVAYPTESPYYYFQAKCDGSGTHNFSITFEEHEQYYCP